MMPAHIVAKVNFSQALIYLRASKRLVESVVARKNFQTGYESIAYAGDAMMGLMTLDLVARRRALPGRTWPSARLGYPAEIEGRDLPGRARLGSRDLCRTTRLLATAIWRRRQWDPRPRALLPNPEAWLGRPVSPSVTVSASSLSSVSITDLTVGCSPSAREISRALIAGFSTFSSVRRSPTRYPNPTAPARTTKLPRSDQKLPEPVWGIPFGR